MHAKVMPSTPSHEASRTAGAVRPGWRVGLVLAVWMAGTTWALWLLSPDLQATAAAVCRSARP